MKYAAQIMILAVVLVLAKHSPAQNPDSLKFVLKSLKGTERIDCLNALSIEYMLAENYDSADHYQALACTESEEQNYIHGLAESFAVKGQIEKYLFDNFPGAEAYLRRALVLYERTPDKRKLENVYSAMWHALHSQSKYEESMQFALRKLEWSRQRNDYRGMAVMYFAIGGDKFQTGEFAECFDLFRKALDLAPKFESAEWSKFLLGKLYLAVGDYNTGLNYYRLAFNQSLLTAERRRIQVNWNIWTITELAEMYTRVGKYDSAIFCYNLIDTGKVHWKDFRVYLVSIGEFYLVQNDYAKALNHFRRALPYHQSINDRSQVIRTQLGMAKSYMGLNKIDETIEYATAALNIAIETLARKYKMDAYELMYKAYDKKSNRDQSNAYFRLYTTMKDSVALDQLRGRVAAVNYENQLSSLAREKIITSQRLQIQKQGLQQAEIVKKALIAGLVFIFFLAVVTMRNLVLRRKRLQAEMREKASELEMAALRSQMNPHFIFNCLNAINHFILANNVDTASDYLIKFSKLIRLVLQTSSQKFVLLSEELETLRLYVELEQLRFKKRFEFIVDVVENLDPESILIPPMLIQPFVENAIWHGLMKSDRPGILTVSIKTTPGFLICSVQDNGIGRSRSQQAKSKSSQYKKSMGVDMTYNRLKLLNDESSSNDHLKISDVVSEDGDCIGTRVEISIPLQSQYSLQDT